MTGDDSRTTPADLPAFANFLAHEIRQPLGSLRLWLELLDGKAELLDEEGIRYLSEIRRAADRIGDMLEEQLLLADLTSREIRPESVDLAALVERVAAELRGRLAAADAEVRIEPLPRIRSDPAFLRPLFRNLIANSVRFRHPDRPLQVHISARETGASDGSSGEQEPDCEIRLEDNGRGFPPEAADRIFQMFERLQDGLEERTEDDPPEEDRPEDDPADGSGLGLAICRRIVERLGGRIEAEGRPGEGAVFIVTLPPYRVEECPEDLGPARPAGAEYTVGPGVSDPPR